ncbi:alcohol dehydrogenase [Maricaulis sp. W15]|uniref:iron-containing alcohol dehydrogenase n=1 Tax=Maricaulis sp. W15 TaxID=1772333 RepID=UPI000948D76F|nr:iron-containing alcohol dehydrogenase [Maricaulis sp. W15]OLF81300.1 alcohol dehydrogenase [Maricaulis sp. W15]
MTHSIVLPRLIRTGSGALGQLPDLLTACGVKRPLIVTDATMVELGYLARLGQGLAQAGIKSGLFDATEPEPTETSVLVAEAILRAGLDGQAFDGLVALGGGSAIDTAKALAVLGPHGGRMRDYKVPRIVDEPGLPVIAIPTTAGTGSEATRVTVITDPDNDEKMLCMGLAFMPVAAILDPDLTLSLPPRVTADTGIDALTHAIEAYVSRKASRFSDQQALAAMRLIAPNLRRAFHDGEDRQAREALLIGACFGGIAFSNASVALVHGMSRPIGAFFHVPHGLSNAMLLPAVTTWSIPAAPTRYADCARAMGVVGDGVSDEIANTALLDELRALNAELGVPTPAGFGIQPERWQQLRPLMAEQALASGSPGNNPRIPTHDEIIALYDEVWG